MQLPMPLIHTPGLLQQRITTTAFIPLTASSALPVIARAVSQQLHRQQQRHRLPPRHQHRPPRQHRRRSDIRRKRDTDTEQKRQPHHTPRTTVLLTGRLQDTDRRQQKQPVNRQRPQGRTGPIRPTLHRELPLMQIRGIRRHPGHHHRTHAPNPRIRISPEPHAGPPHRPALPRTVGQKLPSTTSFPTETPSSGRHPSATRPAGGATQKDGGVFFSGAIPLSSLAGATPRPVHRTDGQFEPSPLPTNMLSSRRSRSDSTCLTETARPSTTTGS